MSSLPPSMSRTLTRGGRFSGVHWWPVLRVHRGRLTRRVVNLFAQPILLVGRFQGCLIPAVSTSLDSSEGPVWEKTPEIRGWPSVREPIVHCAHRPVEH